jgi:translation initiation factor 4E
MDQTIQKDEDDNTPSHKLYDNWTLWAHLPHDTDWSFKSYKEILTFNTVEETISLYGYLPEALIVNSMLFLMRKNIKPMWEDKQNKDGGCFSYRIQNKYVQKIWKHLSYSLVGETLAKDVKHRSIVNGIGISPKKNFCVIKIWLSSCSERDPEIINPIVGLSSHGCLFKKHIMN